MLMIYILAYWQSFGHFDLISIMLFIAYVSTIHSVVISEPFYNNDCKPVSSSLKFIIDKVTFFRFTDAKFHRNHYFCLRNF